jgi:hypothetical protein
MGTRLPRFTIGYYDDDRADDVVVVGQWEMTLAERKFGVGCMEQGSMDAITYATFLGAKRCGLVPEGVAYDAWAAGVALIEEAGLGESQAPLAT